jgi:hypothetical protein
MMSHNSPYKNLASIDRRTEEIRTHRVSMPLRSNSKKELLKKLGHRYFLDCYRETLARLIEWGFKGVEHDTWFITLTFRNECISEQEAFHRLEIWLNRLKWSIIQSGGTASLRYALADERQIKGTIHFHLILYNPGLSSLSPRRWEEKWRKIAGICRIGPYRRKAAPYLVKNITKGSEVIFGGNWQGRTAPIRIPCRPGE